MESVLTKISSSVFPTQSCTPNPPKLSNTLPSTSKSSPSGQTSFYISRRNSLINTPKSPPSPPSSPLRPKSPYTSPRNSLTSIYQPSIEDIAEDKLLDLDLPAQEATSQKSPQTLELLKPFRLQHLRQKSDEGVHSDGDITCNNGGKPLHPSLKKPLQAMNPRRNSSTGNLRDTKTFSFEKQKSSLSKRSVSVPDIHHCQKPVISYSITYDKTSRTLKFTEIKVNDLPVTLNSKDYVYIQCDAIPLDMRIATGTLAMLSDLHFQDDLLFMEMDECEFSKVTILLTVHNVNEEGKKGCVLAEVAFPLAKIHFRDNLPVAMQHNLQTSKRLKRVRINF